ncbi:hypothetical protein PINS_up020813 [Pythium insidiosum]|nr:hypothetical protein PINS_up020813 [Pythium insidiosum]
MTQPSPRPPTAASKQLVAPIALAIAAATVLRYGFFSSVSIVLSASLLTVAVQWMLLSPLCRTPADLPFVVLDILFAVASVLGERLRRGLQPRFPEWTFSFELIRSVFHRVLSRYGTNLVGIPENARYFRGITEILGKIDGALACAKHGTTVEPVVVNGLEHLWLRETLRDAAPRPRLVVLYFHGGGFALFTPRYYVEVCNRIRSAIALAAKAHDDSDRVNSPALDVQVLLANYRKTPDVAYPVPQEDALKMYEYLVTQAHVEPREIVLMGDSAGGGLVMSTLLRLRAAQTLAMPLAAVLSFPFVDFSKDDARGEHCMLPPSFIDASVASLFPNATEHTGPSTWKDACAVYCDLQGLSPVFIQVGSADVLHRDAVKLFQKAQRDGCKHWVLDEHPHMPHVFTTLPPFVLPSAAKGIENIGAFVAHARTRQRVPAES